MNRHSMVTRGKAGIKKPKVFVNEVTNLAEQEPESVEQALAVPHWKKAMLFELGALADNHTWSLTCPPPGRKIIGSRWVFKVKRHSNGTVAAIKLA